MYPAPAFSGVEDFEGRFQLRGARLKPGKMVRAPFQAVRRAREIFRKKDRLKRALASSDRWSGLGDPEISVLAAHPEMEDVLSDAAWASPESGLGDGETLEGFKLKKILKKVFKVVKKFAIPIIAIGLTAASAGAFGPAAVAAIQKGTSVVWGNLKWVGSKLLAAPRAVVDAFTAQGKNIATATPDEVIAIGTAVGAITKGTKPAIETPAEPAPYYPPAPAPARAPYYPPPPYYPPAEAAPAREFEPRAPAAPALPGWFPYALGGGALALVLLSQRSEGRA